MKRIKEKLIKIKFFLIWDGVKRAQFLKKHKILYSMGENCLFQSRNFPMDPKLIKLHNNVSIAANVTFVTHDAIRHVFYFKNKKRFGMHVGCIEIEDNVFIGVGSIIMPNVIIHKNSIVAAGAVVTKSVPENSIVAGVPAKVIGKFDSLEKDREKNDSYLLNKNYDEIIDISWNNFNKNKDEKYD